eukprot:Rhum_TRINITY_DN14264_c5_g2::Rhum_TRINITY_DN14264_c5_g2_i1::g.76463::m.76463
MQRQLATTLRKEKDDARKEDDALSSLLSDTLAAASERHGSPSPLPASAALPGAYASLGEKVEALVALFHDARSAVASCHVQQRMQEQAHRRIIASYEGSLSDAAPALLRRSKDRDERGCQADLLNIGAMTAAVDAADERLKSCEEQLQASQEQNVEKTQCLTEAEATVAEQSHDLQALRSEVRSLQDEIAFLGGELDRAPRGPVLAPLLEAMPSRETQPPSPPKTPTTAGDACARQHDAKADTESQLREALAESVAQRNVLEAELVALRHQLEPDRCASSSAGLEGAQPAARITTGVQTDRRTAGFTLETAKRARSAPSRTSQLGESSSSTSIKDGNEPDHAPSHYSSMYSSTSSRWSFKRGATTAAQPLDLLLPAGRREALQAQLGISPPAAVLHSKEAPRHDCVVLPSPEAGLRFPPGMVQRPALFSLTGARVPAGPHNRRPMKALELPPSPDRRRQDKSAMFRGPMFEANAREHEIVDNLSIPATESVLEFVPGMSPSEVSEPFSPPSSPRPRGGYHQRWQNPQLVMTPVSGVPLSPVHSRLSHRGSAQSALSHSMGQMLCTVGVQTEVCGSSRGTSDLGDSRSTLADTPPPPLDLQLPRGFRAPTHPRGSPSEATSVADVPSPQHEDLACAAEAAAVLSPLSDAAPAVLRKESEDDLQYSCDEAEP